MPVNSAFKDFFNNRLTVKSGIAIVLLVLFFISSSFTKRSDRDFRSKQANLSIRQIGHRLLLQAGDLTSRVLPVTEIKEGTFLLEFENEFIFNHDSLIALSENLLPKTLFPSGYTVTVNDCIKANIIYGFQININRPDIVACRGRHQPAGCYKIEFTFPDFYEKEEQQTVVRRNLEPKKAEPQKNDIGQLAKELKSFKVASQSANSKGEEFKTTTFDYSPIHLVYSGMLVLLGVTLLIGRFWKISKPMSEQNHNSVITKESVHELPALGKFLFDVKAQCLLLGSEVISLTDKECRVLELLHNNFGELIPRETLMQKIWISEGVITGRSLDMFVSKLRKKLSGDPELGITNVHGKGYKLEITGTQIL
ncbi:MAG TPA: winged helix-turn-helix domain-containing protein [Cyclobacteriaceae bacterium]